MKEELVEYLNRTKPNQETIELAARSIISEFTSDIPPNDMKQQLIDVVENRGALEKGLLELEQSPQDRLDAALLVLTWMWEDPAKQPAILAAFEGAKAKLPAIETALLSLVAMYGMYLWATAGRRSEKRTTERKPDGTFKETTVIEYERPGGALSQIGRLFGGTFIQDKSSTHKED